jgi:hypothetical protein
MANNYTQATVSPLIPATLITDTEIGLLEQVGFTAHNYGEWFKEMYEADIGQPYTEQYTDIFDIFQAVMSRSLESEEDEDIDEIIIKGAFTCSKMRPDEFGGFIIRVTPDGIQEGSTDMLLEHFRGEHTPIAEV